MSDAYFTRSGGVVKYAYEYIITSSTVDSIEVGLRVFAPGRERHRMWSVLNTESGDVNGFSGTRNRRVCANCAARWDRITPHGHEGPCDETTPMMPEEGGAKANG